jgi:tetratricopeptide (TPR) repeat protein
MSNFRNGWITAATGLFVAAAVFGPQAGLAADLSKNSNSDVGHLISDALNLMRSNHDAQAAEELKRAIEINPRSAEAHHNYGLALAKLGDTKQAMQQLQTAIDLNPELDSSWLTLAGLHQSVGEIDAAIALYNLYLTKFAARADLNDTRAKIKKLVDGLQAESKSMHEVRNANEAMQNADGKGQTSQSVLQIPAQTAGLDDYLAEATRTGVRSWQKMPIRVFIHDANGVPGYHLQWRNILIRSFNDWSTASNGLVKFEFADDPATANLDCYFMADPTHDHGGMKNDAEAGEANMFMDQNGIIRGEIKFLTRSLSPVLPLTDNRMRVICLHEIGHALGLAGHTANPDDIMFYSTSFKDEWRDLTGRDARTIQRLYASK